MYYFIKKNIFFYFLTLCLNCLQILVANKEVIEYSEPSRCKNNEYFDVESFTCIQCDINKNFQPSSDRLKCTCNKFSKQTNMKDVYTLCTVCGSNTTVTIDGKDCISCNNGICKCTINEIQIDRHWNGTLLDTMHCLPCINNTYPSLDKSKCLPCNNFEYNYYTNDIYMIEYYSWVQGYCLYNNTSSNQLNTSVKYFIQFENQNIDSYYFRHELQAAIYSCNENNKLACAHLSNMCALSLYSNKIACALFKQMQITSTWLFYNKSEVITTLNSKNITQKYSLLKFRNDSILNFTAVTFSLRGNFKTIGTPNLPCNLLENVRFGINLRKTCKLKIKDLLKWETEFISPYITFLENKRYYMHALPVFITNINQNNNETSNWQLVRKFFLVDNISGFKTTPNYINDKVKTINKLSILRYMKSLSVIINVQDTENKNKIFPPLLIIEYSELTRKQLDETAEVTLDYKIKFVLSSSNIDFNVKIIVGIFSGLALLFSGIKTWNYSKQHHTCFFNVAVLLWFFIYTVGAVGNVIILTVIGLCIYLFIFYKCQTIPYVLLFDDINEKTIKVFTIVAFFFKFIEILGFICQYWNINIFFIDWEQPKAIYNQLKYDSPHRPLYNIHTNKFSKDTHKPLQMSSKIIAAQRKKILHELDQQNNLDCCFTSFTNNKYKADPSSSSTLKDSVPETNEDNSFNELPVSVWRTYFIASQWLKLQTQRKINIILQLLAVLCTFQVAQLYPWILTIPKLTFKTSEDNYNFTLYYTVCTLLYILIYCIQWLLSVAFYERCITNKMQEFVNLCSITNISVFILPFNYYGFYIHGRSVHGFADTDLPTLMSDLNKEKNNLCAHRGLVPGTTQQTFILSLTKTFKTVFMRLSKNIKRPNLLKMYYFSTINWEQNFNTHLKLRKFFSKFVDHCFNDVDYIIKEQHFLEKLCNVMSFYNEEKSVFYIDHNYSFNHVLLYGNEWLLATFEISIFTLIIVLYNDCILATTITILTSMLLITITKCNRKKNLSNNALLSETFLL